jgi:hypothetical protein
MAHPLFRAESKIWRGNGPGKIWRFKMAVWGIKKELFTGEIYDDVYYRVEILESFMFFHKFLWLMLTTVLVFLHF